MFKACLNTTKSFSKLKWNCFKSATGTLANLPITRAVFCKTFSVKEVDKFSPTKSQYNDNPILKKLENEEKYALSFKEFNFLPEIYQALDQLQIFSPTSIQSVAIPRIMANRHVFFASQTGTGKTLSYVLPLLNSLKLQEKVSNTRLTMMKRPRALIIVPSRELAQQVEEVCKLFTYDVPLVVESFFVGKDFSTERKYSKSGIDILITTPERFANHWGKYNIFASKLTHVVIDELDTHLDAGNEEFLNKIIKLIHDRNQMDVEENTNKTMSSVRQVVLASTTITPSIDTFLSKAFQSDEGSNFVKIIDKSTNHNLSNVKHEFVQVTNFDKLPTLLKILSDNEKLLKQNLSIIIFCNNINCTRKIGLTLEEKGISNSCIHGDIPPLRRKRELYDFKTRKTKILICTDLIARGMDFPFVYLVINFDFPKTLSDYLHRAGRTGRGGRKGVVVSFYRRYDNYVIEKIKNAQQMNLPMDINNSMYNLRTTTTDLKNKRRPSVGLSNRSFPQTKKLNEFTKRTTESLLINTRRRRELLDKYKEKMKSDRNTMLLNLNKRNMKRGYTKRVAKLKKKNKYKIK